MFADKTQTKNMILSWSEIPLIKFVSSCCELVFKTFCNSYIKLGIPIEEESAL